MREALERPVLQRLYDRIASRYDVQHAVITGRADARGRKALVTVTVREGDRVLDAGGGTGSTALLAARATGAVGRVWVLDMSRGMLRQARQRMKAAREVRDRIAFVIGDIQRPPFRHAAFDVVLSTYSMCPLADPAGAASALYDTVRPGGLMGVAHSTEPRGRLLRWLGDRLETLAWRIPALSMGCRAVSVLPRLAALGAVVESDRRLGPPLWPFHIFVVRKPSRNSGSLV